VSNLVIFILLGLGSGAFIAGLGVSLVVSFRGTGTVNLAGGAVATLSAYVFYGLRVDGQLLTPPVPLLPAQVDLGGPVALPVAVGVAVLYAAVVGALLEFFVLRKLQQAPPLSKLIATLGLLLFIQAWLLVRYGIDGLSAPPVLAGSSVTVLGTPVPTDRFIFSGIVLALTAVLVVLYKSTAFGLATRAAAEDEGAAMRYGLSPGRLSSINTVMAFAIAGLLGVLFAPLAQLDITTLSFAIIPALAAALIGRFSSFVPVVVAGFVMGAIQSGVTWGQIQAWFPTAGGTPVPGVADLIFFIIVILVVYLRGSAIPERGTLVERSLPPSPAPEGVLKVTVVLTALCVLGLAFLPGDSRQGLINTMIGSLACLSLVIITGFVGQVSLLQAGLAGLSAVIVTKLGAEAGWGFPLAPAAGVAAAVAFGLVTALPALRIRGVQLAIVTLSGAVALSEFVLGNTSFGFDPTAQQVARPSLFGVGFGPNDLPWGPGGGTPSATFGLFCLIVTVVLMLVTVSLRLSGLGRRMLAVRSNERAAAAAGINVRETKLVAYALSSLVAGVAGVLYAYNFGAGAASNYDITVGLGFVAFAYLGGISTVKGAIIAGTIVTASIVVHFVNGLIGRSPNGTLVLAGFFLIVAVVQYPGGLAQAPPPWRPLTWVWNLISKRSGSRTGASKEAPATKEMVS